MLDPSLSGDLLLLVDFLEPPFLHVVSVGSGVHVSVLWGVLLLGEADVFGLPTLLLLLLPSAACNHGT